MKIERISENKIKCTLNRADLDSRNIVLTEFAYGSEKARAFFRELMLQAEDEVGFEAEDIPLMIEAIPVNQDCIILFVTKVSDPEELDTRFSRFSSNEEDSDDYLEEELEEGMELDEESTNLLGVVKDAVRSAVEGLSKAAEDGFIPLNESVQKVDTKPSGKKQEQPKNHSAIFCFQNLDDVCSVSRYLKDSYRGDNTLYKNMTGGEYYLVLGSGGQQPDAFTRICNILSEYGKRERSSYAMQAYYEEHFLCVIRSNALQTLANLS
ncbi:MAG: adaptor protein MecA [Lachnospiraceae bacterium]|nr:adaptor protein MecA [Lachnospiraceae bacterium]